LTALLQAAGGTMPVIKKDERGVFVLVESASGHAPSAAKPAAAKTATAGQPQKAPVSAAATPKPPAAAPKPAAPKAGAEADRKLFKRSNYMGVADTGPVPGETFEQKVVRLKAVTVAARRRAEEGGGDVAPSVEKSAASIAPEVQTSALAPVAAAESSESAPSVAAAPAPAASSNNAHKPTGNADRTLMRRSTYGDVVDSGPVAEESFEQKVERLRAVSAAAKQRAEQG